MFKNIFKGFSFIKESFKLIYKNSALIKPSIYSILAGLFFTVISVIVLILIRSQIPEGIFYVLAFLILLGDYYIAYFFTGMTAFLIYDYFKGGHATMSDAWAATKKKALAIFYMSIISAIIKVITSIIRREEGQRGSAAGGIANMILDFVESAWTVATYLIIPAIVIEDKNLRGAIGRATDIIKKNLLPIGVGEIAVGLVTGILSFIGLIVAIVIVVMLFNVLGGAIIGALVAMSVAAVLILLIVALSMYITTAYHTCLFLWATNVETVKASSGTPGAVKPPAPIAGSLGI
jgi:hypothetical protein